MVPVLKIQITRAEGPTKLCGIPYTVPSFEMASLVFSSIAQTAPDSGGYDKCDFSVTFEDGEQYLGRADITRKHTVGYDLREHIIGFLSYLGGTRQPTHINDTLWKQVKARNEASGEAGEARAWLKHYFGTK